jgi:hypothetical protein
VKPPNVIFNVKKLLVQSAQYIANAQFALFVAPRIYVKPLDALNVKLFVKLQFAILLVLLQNPNVLQFAKN